MSNEVVVNGQTYVLKGRQKTRRGTSTRILWAVMIQTMILTIMTWLIAVVQRDQAVLSALAGIVTLITAPAGVAVTMYQLSKWQNRDHAIKEIQAQNGNHKSAVETLGDEPREGA